MRSPFVAFAIFSLSITACSTEASGTGAPAPDEDAALDEAGLDEDARDGGPGAGGDAASTGPGLPGANEAGASSPVADGASADGALPDGEAAPDALSCGSPSGTYAATCTQCTVSGAVLKCDCETGTGSSAPSSLDLCACPNTATISNAHGVLTCCGNPGGTYLQTCAECATTDTVLGCTCETDNGGYVSSFLALCTCQPPALIANTNGVLTCR